MKELRKTYQNNLADVILTLLKEYDIDVSKHVTDRESRRLIAALDSGKSLSFKNFGLLLNMLGLSASIEVEGDPDIYPSKSEEIYSFPISIKYQKEEKILHMDIDEDDDMLVKFIKKSINDKKLTSAYFEGRMTEMEFKNLMTILQGGTMSIKLFDRVCKILGVNPIILDLNNTDKIDDAKAVSGVTSSSLSREND